MDLGEAEGVAEWVRQQREWEDHQRMRATNGSEGDS